MNNLVLGNKSLKIKQMKYDENNKLFRASSVPRNPIKVVVQMIGEDGLVHQEIIKENHTYRKDTKLKTFRMTQSMPKIQKQQEYPVESRTFRSTKPQGLARSFVFNRFNYDNYRDFPIPKTLKSKPGKLVKSSSTQKNIQIVFCENKLPDFVRKTNDTIEQIYKKEQVHEHNLLQNKMRNTMMFNKMLDRDVQSKKFPKTNLANCLKEYATLQKLSIFMESDQQRRQKCLCYEREKDPSRTLLLQIITHRFKFFKSMSKRIRQTIYRIILGRQINALTKINIQEYMKISEMFVGRDANNNEVAILMYIFLFGEKIPTFELAKEKLQLMGGQKHKLKSLLEEIYCVLVQAQTEEYLVEILSSKDKLLRMFIDFLIER